MKDPELMLELLGEMSESPDGTMIAVRTYGMSQEARRRRHHIELLVDAAHARWTGPRQEIVRITNHGYEFLKAIELGEQHRTTFVERINRGVDYLRVVSDIVKLVQ